MNKITYKTFSPKINGTTKLFKFQPRIITHIKFHCIQEFGKIFQRILDKGKNANVVGIEVELNIVNFQDKIWYRYNVYYYHLNALDRRTEVTR